jgi:hypothetical protein
VLALELAANGAEIDAINRSEGNKSSAFIKKQLSKDFGYIVIYVVFLSCLALLLTELVSDWSKYLNLAAVVCAVMAGVFDVIENLRMLKATSTPAPVSVTPVYAICGSTLHSRGCFTLHHPIALLADCACAKSVIRHDHLYNPLLRHRNWHRTSKSFGGRTPNTLILLYGRQRTPQYEKWRNTVLI